MRGWGAGGSSAAGRVITRPPQMSDQTRSGRSVPCRNGTNHGQVFVERRTSRDALTGFDRVYGDAGRDTLRLDVSAEVFALQGFQDEIHAFVPGDATILRTVGVTARDVERLEVYVDETRKFATGLAAVDPGAAAKALIHDADLWGLM